MVRFAHDHGYSDLTERTFTNWVEHGLIAQAARTGLGPGKGVARTWDGHQAQLLLQICRLRQQTDRLAVLANIPVGMWLLFGDEYVGTTQAMTAMCTWADATGSTSARRARPSAKALAEQIAGPKIDPRIRNRFVELITEFAPHPGNFDRAGFERMIMELVEASPTPLAVSARGLAALTEARVLAVQHMNRFTPDDFETARANYLTTRADYQQSLEYDPATSTLNEAMTTACLNTATWLGMTARGFDH
jgi:hypothetical protein